MPIAINYDIREKLNSISGRIKFISNNYNTYSEHTDPIISRDNLDYNFSLIISHIIFNLVLPDCSREAFQIVLDEYNITEGTNITFESFENTGFIRLINGDIVLPEAVRSHISSLIRELGETDSSTIDLEKNDFIECLKIYYKKYLDSSKYFISKTILLEILEHYAHQNITIDSLLERSIIKYDNDTDLYYWASNQYTRYLKIEIIAGLWTLFLQSETVTLVEYNKFVKLIHILNLHIVDFTKYFNNNENEKLVELSMQFISSQDDFLKSDIEFKKIWLDSPQYIRRNLFKESPVLYFNYDNVYSFIHSVTKIKTFYNGIFDYQHSRAYIFSILTIIKFDLNREFPYQKITLILKDLNRPFLLWMLYREIPKNHQEIIPYLLIDLELAPLAYKMVDDLDINEVYTKKYSSRNQQLLEQSKIKNEIFYELFDITLELCDDLNHSKKDKGEMLIKILLDIAAKVFKYYSNDSYISHKEYHSRYNYIIKLLVSKREKKANIYDGFNVRPHFIIDLLPYMIFYLLNNYETLFEENITLDFPFLDVSIEILRMSNIQFIEGEINNDKKKILEGYSSVLIKRLYIYTSEFFTTQEVETNSYLNMQKETKSVYRGLRAFGYEIVDWGYLFLLFEKQDLLSELYDTITKSINFNENEFVFETHNIREVSKLKAFFKSILLAFLGITNKKNEYEIERLPVKETIKKLTQWTEYLAKTYSIDDIAMKRVNLFDEKLNIYGSDLHYESLRTLLFKTINLLDKKQAKKIVKDFFYNSIDVGHMVAAINIFNSKSLNTIVAESLSKVNIEKYIESRGTITELQEALIEVINSDEHWKIATPLIERIKKHIEKYDYPNNDIIYILYNVDLLLALKEKDFNKINDIPVPAKKYAIYNSDNKAENLKKFFIGLHYLHNKKDFDKAIMFFHSISSNEDNLRYAFHLFRAQTLKAVKNNDSQLLGIAFQHWENVSRTFNENEDNEFIELKFAIVSNQLHYYFNVKDYLNFKQNITILPKAYLYDKEIIPIVYEYYLENEISENAFAYLNDAVDYMKDRKQKIPNKIEKLRKNSTTRNVLLGFKNSFIHIRSLLPNDIPLITPDIVNNKRNLNDFILNELIKASKIMIEKIQGIKTIPHENRFNDLLVAILRLRFQLWSWSIHDQARKGNSATQKDAGETDMTIEAGNITIGLIEALILTSRNKAITQSHVQKIFSYSKNLERYYMIIYYRGKSANLDSTWLKYKEDVRSITFPQGFAMNLSKDFVELEEEYDDVNHLKLAKTIHFNNIEVFHILIDLSEKAEIT